MSFVPSQTHVCSLSDIIRCMLLYLGWRRQPAGTSVLMVGPLGCWRQGPRCPSLANNGVCAGKLTSGAELQWRSGYLVCCIKLFAGALIPWAVLRMIYVFKRGTNCYSDNYFMYIILLVVVRFLVCYFLVTCELIYFLPTQIDLIVKN